MKSIKRSLVFVVILSLIITSFFSFNKAEAVNPTVTITASSNPVCGTSPNNGGQTTYFATPANAGSGFVSYEWYVGGYKQASYTDSTYVASKTVNGMTARAVLNLSNGQKVNSNIIQTSVATLPLQVSVSVSTPATTLTPGTSATFTATPVNGGTNPSYQWNVNGVNVTGATNATYTYIPEAGDAVKVILKPNSSCSVTSNIVYINMTCPGIPTVNYEGKTYNTTKIGNQCWLRENLNVGTKIVSTSNQTNNNVVEKYCYDNSDSNCDTYGGLYQWAEAVGYLNGVTNTTHWSPLPTTPVKGICPVGWHIPTWEENVTMQTTLGSGPGGKMKELGLTHWWGSFSTGYNLGAKNSSGFTSLGSGNISNGISSFLKNYASYWTTKGSGSNGAHFFGTTFVADQTTSGQNLKTTGVSVRCLKDETLSTVASVSIVQIPMGGVVNFIATPVNGGTNPSYQWKKNGQNVTTAQPLNPSYVFVLANPIPGDVITVEMTSSITAGITGSPATSNPITITGLPATAPDAPTNIIITFETNLSPAVANLSWTPPVNNGGAPIYGYKVEYRQILSTPVAWSSVTTQGTSTSITGLIAGSKYEYKISSISSITSIGQGPSSNIITAPSKVTGVVATPEGTGKVLLSWVTPNNGGSPLTHFRIRYKATDVAPIPNNWGTYMQVNDPNATSTYIMGLTPGKIYEFKVRAVGSSFGEWSDIATSSPIASIPASSLIGGVAGSLTDIEPSEAVLVKQQDTLTTNLSYGKKHEQIKILQQFLNSKGYNVIQTGKETTNFGKATKQALIKFQKDNNITPASGNLGIKTRTLINEMINGSM